MTVQTQIDPRPRRVRRGDGGLTLWQKRLLATAMLLLVVQAPAEAHGKTPLKVAVFNVDATPPLGTPLCDGLVEPAREIVDPLSARGIVLLGAGSPIVLCAVDWVGIGNRGHVEWREALAEAAGTTPERVAVHTLHQHDAPGCDFSAEDYLSAQGLGGHGFDIHFARTTIARVAAAVRSSLASVTDVTHVGRGAARVAQVASNRRILGPDGKVAYVRFSSSKIPEAIAAPEGTIDPDVQVISLWNGEAPVVALSYYATHPQSHYGQGGVSADFVGLARSLHEQSVPGLPLIHFNGAGGNVAAGKYNDGSPENRPILAGRLAQGIRAAWDNTQKTALTAEQVTWRVAHVALPLAAHLDRVALTATLQNKDARMGERVRASRDLAWLDQVDRGDTTLLSALDLGPAVLVHLPGELFVEYQLSARSMRPDAAVCVAAYGDYGPGYIGTAEAYPQGGYETSFVSRVAPEVEQVLTDGLKALLAPQARDGSR